MLLRLGDNKHLVLYHFLADCLDPPRGPLHFYAVDFRAVSQAEETRGNSGGNSGTDGTFPGYLG